MFSYRRTIIHLDETGFQSVLSHDFFIGVRLRQIGIDHLLYQGGTPILPLVYACIMSILVVCVYIFN